MTAFEGLWDLLDLWLYGMVCGCFVSVVALSLFDFMALQGFTAACTAEFIYRKTLL